MSAKPRNSSPTDPGHWNPEVPGWPTYHPHRPRRGWDDRRLLMNLIKVIAAILLTLALLLGLSLVIAGGWDGDSAYWVPQRIQAPASATSIPWTDNTP